MMKKGCSLKCASKTDIDRHDSVRIFNDSDST